MPGSSNLIHIPVNSDSIMGTQVEYMPSNGVIKNKTCQQNYCLDCKNIVEPSRNNSSYSSKACSNSKHLSQDTASRSSDSSERTKKKAWYNSLFPTYKSRSEEVKSLFETIPADERLVVYYSCALQRDILLQGRLYVTQNYLCFYANIFGWETKVCVNLKDVSSITKENIALVIPNSILVITNTEKLFFASFTARNEAYLMVCWVWERALTCRPFSPQELWHMVHTAYGEELGLTSEDEDYDYTSPGSSSGQLDQVPDTESSSSVNEETMNRSSDSAKAVDQCPQIVEEESNKEDKQSVGCVGNKKSDGYNSLFSTYKSRSEEVKRHFNTVPQDERLIVDYSCALQRDILVQGRLYITQNYLCFYAKIFDCETKVCINLKDVSSITKENVALVIPNAIVVSTDTEKLVFESFTSQNDAYLLLFRVWQRASTCRPFSAKELWRLVHKAYGKELGLTSDGEDYDFIPSFLDHFDMIPVTPSSTSLNEDSISRSSDSTKGTEQCSSAQDQSRKEGKESLVLERGKKKAWYNSLFSTYKSRSEEVKKYFKNIPRDERLVIDYSCALQRDILLQGRLYVTQNYLCFYAKIFGWETKVCVNLKDVSSITKENIALVIPNSILVSTNTEKLFFASFTARNEAYLLLFRVWQNALMSQPFSPQELWQIVHTAYGKELGLTSDDEDYDYTPPGSSSGQLDQVPDTESSSSLNEETINRSSDSVKAVDQCLPIVEEESSKEDKQSVVCVRNKKAAWYNSLFSTYKSRSEEVRRHFKNVPQDERLVVDYSCALQRDILVQGRLYITQNHLCFYANIFGWGTKVCVNLKDVLSVTKGKTALVIPNAISVSTNTEKLLFTSFTARNEAYLMIFRVWQNALMSQPFSTQELWHLIHKAYGKELGLTSDDEDYDYTPPGSSTGHFDMIPPTLSSNSLNEDTLSRSFDSAKGTEQCSSVQDQSRKEVKESLVFERIKKKAWYNSLFPTYKSRSEEVKSLFETIPADERLVVDYSCALQRDILVQGRLYITQNYLCFYANIFGWGTKVCVNLKDVSSVTKGKTALVIPNAILVSTNTEKLFFTSFTARDQAYVMIFRVWQNALMSQPFSTQELWHLIHKAYGKELGLTSDDEDYDYIPPGPSSGKFDQIPNTLSPNSLAKGYTGSEDKGGNEIGSNIIDSTNSNDGSLPVASEQVSLPHDVPIASEAMSTDMSDDSSESDPKPNVGMKMASCTSPHDGRLVVNTPIPVHIDQLFQLLFTNSKFLVEFHSLRGTTDFRTSAWQKNPDTSEKMRIISMVVALTKSIGPRSSNVHETQILLPCSEPGQLYSIDGEVVNSGVPYSDSFYIKVHYCLERVSANETNLNIYAQPKYKKHVWGLMKNIIEKSIWDGLAEFYDALVKSLLAECDDTVPKSGKVRRRHRLSKPVLLPMDQTPTSTRGSSVTDRDNKNGVLLFIVLAVLVSLVFLNIILFYKLRTLEEWTQSTKSNIWPPDWEVLRNPPKTNEEWLKALRDQESLQRVELDKWQNVLHLVVQLLRKAEGSLNELLGIIKFPYSDSVTVDLENKEKQEL